MATTLGIIVVVVRSGPFDIHDEQDKFARALVVYATMDEDAMGLDTFIEREDGCRHVRLDDASQL